MSSSFSISFKVSVSGHQFEERLQMFPDFEQLTAPPHSLIILKVFITLYDSLWLF